MPTYYDSKLKLLINLFDSQKFLFSKELLDKGYSNDLVQYYRKAGWIKSIGKGVYTRPDREITLYDALETFQKKMTFDFHLGGKSCLASVYNIQHFAVFKESMPELFCRNLAEIPLWFKTTFKQNVVLRQTDFLKSDAGIEKVSFAGNEVEVSAPERGFLELLNYIPKETSVSEAKEILELLVNLRPALLQELLCSSTSIKVNRLFLYLSEDVNHSWFKYLNLDNINLGNGVREIEKGGKLIGKYKIVVREEEI